MPNFNNINFCNIDEIRSMNGIGDLVDSQKLQVPLQTSSMEVQNTLGDALALAFKRMIYGANPVVSITAANPPVVTTANAHNYATGDTVAIDRPKGMVSSEGSYRAVVTSPTQFELWTVIDTDNPVSIAWDGTGWGSYTARSGVTYAISSIRYQVFLLARYMQAMLAGRDCINVMALAKSNNGILIPEGNGYKGGDQKDYALLRSDAVSKANMYGTRISRMLCEYSEEFPELDLVTDGSSGRTNPSGRFDRMKAF